MNDELAGHNDEGEDRYIDSYFSDFVGYCLQFSLERGLVFLNVELFLCHS